LHALKRGWPEIESGGSAQVADVAVVAPSRVDVDPAVRAPGCSPTGGRGGRGSLARGRGPAVRAPGCSPSGGRGGRGSLARGRGPAVRAPGCSPTGGRGGRGSLARGRGPAVRVPGSLGSGSGLAVAATWSTSRQRTLRTEITWIRNCKR
jgi:hypothetical protein